MLSLVVDENAVSANIIEIEDKNDINHMKNTFRLTEEDKIRVVDGKKEYFCKILEIDKKKVILEILEISDDTYSSEVKVDIAMGILKNDKMDLSVQKLTEIGINKVIPLNTKRTVVKLDKKKEKWDTISKESLKQCRGIKFLEIDEIKKIDEIVFNDYDLIFVLYENEKNNGISTVLKNINKDNIKKVLYIIGPEGGFEEDEINYIISNGGKSISLGKRILRAETASIVAGGIIINEFNT